ncbi:MAG: ABC transporter permease [Isosphaeraceae bacterium]
MIDLALRMLLDEKARFAATVLGVGFAAALVLIQVGIFFGLLENASISIEHLSADLWVTSRNAPNVDFGNPFPEGYVRRVRSIPGVERADNLIVWYAIVALPNGARESVVYYGLEDFPAWRFPWDVESGDPADLRRGRYAMLDASAERRFGAFRPGDYREFQGRRLKIIGRTRGALSFTTSPMAFLDYRLAQLLSPADLAGRTTFVIVRLAPGTDVEAVRREIRARLPYNDVYTRDEWASRSRGYWIESTGLGLTLALTVGLGALVGVVIVGQTLYASTTEHLTDFGTVKALGGGNLTVYGIIAEQATFAAALGYALALALSFALRPVLASLDMKMNISVTMAAMVYVGTLALCLAAASLSFRKVASLDPAIVFRG